MILLSVCELTERAVTQYVLYCIRDAVNLPLKTRLRFHCGEVGTSKLREHSTGCAVTYKHCSVGRPFPHNFCGRNYTVSEIMRVMGKQKLQRVGKYHSVL